MHAQIQISEELLSTDLPSVPMLYVHAHCYAYIHLREVYKLLLLLWVILIPYFDLRTSLTWSEAHPQSNEVILFESYMYMYT